MEAAIEKWLIVDPAEAAVATDVFEAIDPSGFHHGPWSDDLSSGVYALARMYHGDQPMAAMIFGHGAGDLHIHGLAGFDPKVSIFMAAHRFAVSCARRLGCTRLIMQTERAGFRRALLSVGATEIAWVMACHVE